MNLLCELKTNGAYVPPASPLQKTCRNCGKCKQTPKPAAKLAAHPKPASTLARPKPASTLAQREAAALECRQLTFQNARLREQVAQRERLEWHAKHGDKVARIAQQLAKLRS
jgi:hypothetical protein